MTARRPLRIVPEVRATGVALQLGPALLELVEVQVAARHRSGGVRSASSVPPRSPWARCRPAPQAAPWQSLYFLPLPHQQGSLRPTFCSAAFTTGTMGAASPAADATPAGCPLRPVAATGSTAGLAEPARACGCVEPRGEARRGDPVDRPPGIGQERRVEDAVVGHRIVGRLVHGVRQVGLGRGLHQGLHVHHVAHVVVVDPRPSAGRTSRSPRAARRPGGPAGPWPAGGCPRAGSPSRRGGRASAGR